ncbi:hypothetical protein AA0119_g6374 [Alternaria tenuissima]|uniref:Uncharacterized protein n=3 Tax=Alternaria sect. Alternaria TaxID=2499237 RepID=A0A4Q4NDW9_ALTAL|nr:hypothetical protein AA0117_g7427 [Alternaria alternata]RYO00058.1 hypothetical protein AA0119_g6374 [Alternaria tenuissima]
MTDRDLDMGTTQGAPDKATTMTSIIALPSPAPNLPRLSDQKLEKVPKFLKAAYRPKPNTSICLNKEFPVIEGLCFNNMSEAQKSMAVAQWYAPQEDETIPKTEEEHRRIVVMLVDAFKDMSIAKDTATNAYRKRFTPGETSYYQDWAIEACAWDIIDKAKYIHTEGFKVPIYDKSIVDYIGQTQKWLFGERIDWICQVLKSSKHVAVTLMKHEKNWITIGAPHKLYSSTLVNTISNAHRGKWIKDGRGADRNHQDRPFKGKRTKDQVTFSEGEVVGMDLPNNVDSGTVAGSEETGAQNQELIRKRQKIEHIAFESKDFDTDDAMTAESDAGVQSVEKPEKSHMSNESIINSMVDSSDGDSPTKSFAVDPRQDACVNYYLDTNIKGRSGSDNESELSEPPDGLLPDALYASPINKKTDDPRVDSSTLEPRMDDAAHLDGAHMLVSLSASR